MDKNVIYNLFLNLKLNLQYLFSDFVKISFDYQIIFKTLINLLLAITIIIVYYLIGNKIRRRFFKIENLNKINYLIDICLGFILVGTCLGTIGFFSKLVHTVLYIFIFLITAIAIYPINSLIPRISELFDQFIIFISSFKKNKLVFFFVFIFIIIGILKLISPEIREDQYHTDYPKYYLQQHTTMIPPGEPLRAQLAPQLVEMTYMITILLNAKESSRVINFLFYIFILFTFYSISKKNKYKSAIYAMLIFASTPVIVKETSTAYVEFPFILCLLVSAFVLCRNKLTYKEIILSGILFGGMLATKLWTIAFIPIPLIYLLTQFKIDNQNKLLKYILFFLFSALIIPSIWYLRSYILSGDFFYPAFTNNANLANIYQKAKVSYYFGLNFKALSISNLKELSPLFFIGLLFFFIKIKHTFKLIYKVKIYLFTFLLLIEHMFIQYYLGRYLLGIYPLLCLIAAVGIESGLKTNNIFKYLIIFLLIIFSSYYFINSLLALPYGLGWADKNKYLTRILSRDNSSYYNFNHLFEKHLGKNDFVAVHNLNGFYYADFLYLDTNYIFPGNKRTFSEFKDKRITKFIIHGGDINWFCVKYKISDCKPRNYKLLAVYPDSLIYLYSIK